mmetsp:Transcript_17860/g.15765  ORF Transcript_17860/g.15765 Transcript_17860/m.15765 type:complete len:159 (-) Transcript_17860:466-942(-)
MESSEPKQVLLSLGCLTTILTYYGKYHTATKCLSSLSTQFLNFLTQWQYEILQAFKMKHQMGAIDSTRFKKLLEEVYLDKNERPKGGLVIGFQDFQYFIKIRQSMNGSFPALDFAILEGVIFAHSSVKKLLSNSFSNGLNKFIYNEMGQIKIKIEDYI